MAVSTSNEPATTPVRDPAIRPFRIDVPQEEVDELRVRGAHSLGAPLLAAHPQRGVRHE